VVYLITIWFYGFFNSAFFHDFWSFVVFVFHIIIWAYWQNGEKQHIFFSVGYYVMHLFFGVCVVVLFLLRCFCCWSFVIFCYHNLVLFFEEGLSKFFNFFLIVEGCLQYVLMRAYVIWLELFNLSKYQQGLIYILMKLLMGLFVCYKRRRNFFWFYLFLLMHLYAL